MTMNKYDAGPRTAPTKPERGSGGRSDPVGSGFGIPPRPGPGSTVRITRKYLGPGPSIRPGSTKGYGLGLGLGLGTISRILRNSKIIFPRFPEFWRMLQTSWSIK